MAETEISRPFRGAAVAAILMALTLFVGSTGPVETTCTGPSGGVENCAGPEHSLISAKDLIREARY